MKVTIVIVGIFLLFTAVGYVGQELGFTVTAITPPAALKAPAGSGGLFGFVKEILLIPVYIFNSFSSFLQLLVFGIDGMPDGARFTMQFIMLAVSVFIIKIGLNLIRGTGD